MLLIDGHNLIGRDPGLSLEDEERSRETLLARIAAALGAHGEPVMVVFDSGRPGSARETRFGKLKVVYAPAARTADDEILRRLSGSNPRGSTVVTSDRELARRAAGLGARVISATEFLNRMASSRNKRRPNEEKPESSLSDVDEWLELFRSARPH